MNPKIFETELKKVLKFSNEFFSDQANFKYLIPKEIQDSELLKLNHGLREEQFFLIIDLIKFEVTFHGGLSHFGHNSKSFSISDYYQMLPDNNLTSLLTLIGKQTFLLSESNLIAFLKPTFITLVPLRAYVGMDKLFLFKRNISPWQITECGKITSYLSHFTVIKEYEFEALNPRIIGIPEKVQKMVMKRFNFEFNQQKVKENPFSPKEILLLLQYLDDDKSVSDILLNLSITLNTLHDYNKSILTKTKKLFGERVPVKTARDAASFINKQGLLEY